MNKKTFFASLTLFLSSFFLMGTLSAMSPEIWEDMDPETKELRLFVRGNITVPPKDETSQPFPLGFRTCALEDFTQKTDGSWGIISQLRADPVQMTHFIGGPRNPHITHEKAYLGIWRKRVLEKEGGCYTPATVFTLLTQDPNTPETKRFIGYFGLGRNTPTQLIFFGGLLPEFQNRGIMTSLVEYLLSTLLPAFRTHPLTAEKSREEHQELLITMDNQNPLSDQIVKSSVPKFSQMHNIPVQHKIVKTKDRPQGEHQITVNLETLYEKREANAAAGITKKAAAGTDPETAAAATAPDRTDQNPLKQEAPDQ